MTEFTQSSDRYAGRVVVATPERAQVESDTPENIERRALETRQLAGEMLVDFGIVRRALDGDLACGYDWITPEGEVFAITRTGERRNGRTHWADSIKVEWFLPDNPETCSAFVLGPDSVRASEGAMHFGPNTATALRTLREHLAIHETRQRRETLLTYFDLLHTAISPPGVGEGERLILMTSDFQRPGLTFSFSRRTTDQGPLYVMHVKRGQKNEMLSYIITPNDFELLPAGAGTMANIMPPMDDPRQHERYASNIIRKTLLRSFDSHNLAARQRAQLGLHLLAGQRGIPVAGQVFTTTSPFTDKHGLPADAYLCVQGGKNVVIIETQTDETIHAFDPVADLDFKDYSQPNDPSLSQAISRIVHDALPPAEVAEVEEAETRSAAEILTEDVLEYFRESSTLPSNAPEGAPATHQRVLRAQDTVFTFEIVAYGAQETYAGRPRLAIKTIHVVWSRNEDGASDRFVLTREGLVPYKEQRTTRTGVDIIFSSLQRAFEAVQQRNAQ